MARSSVPVVDVPHEGSADVDANLTSADASNGMKWVNTGRDVLVVKNPSGADETFTVLAVQDEAGRSVDLGAVTVSSGGGIEVVDMLNPSWWNQRDGTGEIHVDFSSSNLDVVVLRFKEAH